MKDRTKHFVSVAGVVIKNSKILTIQRNDNKHWQIPGGLLDKEEKIIDGLRREILEETNIEIQNPVITGIYHHLDQGTFSMVFKCDFLEGETKCSDETDKVEWMEYSTIEELFKPAFSIRVKDAIDYKGKMIIRQHNGEELID